MNTPDHRAITAHHEAGHAVAAVMRGGSTLTSITLQDDHSGITWHRGKPTDGPFIAYAGPWAEARHSWPEGVPLDGQDDEWLTFDDYVAGVFLHQSGDLEALRPHDEQVQQLRAQGVDVPGGYAVWDHELERVWPVVREVAGRLLDGETLTDAQVRDAMEAAEARDQKRQRRR